MRPEREACIKRCIEGLGYELVGVQWPPGRGGTIRIYAEKSGGITVWDCARISDEIKDLLLVEYPLSAQMLLEVSSPGLNRPLFTAEQYAHIVGQDIKVHLAAPKDGRRAYKGQLLSVTEEGVRVKEEQGEYEVLFSEIKKAHVVAKL